MAGACEGMVRGKERLLSLEGEFKRWSEGEVVIRGDVGQGHFCLVVNMELRSAGT